MKVYLVRHGEAVPAAEDAARVLTDKGREDAARLAAVLKGQGVRVDKLWHSTRLRAIQTAEIVAREIGARDVSQRRDGLGPDDDVERWAQELVGVAEDLMLVGHLPFLKRLASLLLTRTLDYDVPGFAVAGAVCLERMKTGAWRFVWALGPEMVPKPPSS